MRACACVGPSSTRIPFTMRGAGPTSHDRSIAASATGGRRQYVSTFDVRDYITDHPSPSSTRIPMQICMLTITSRA